MDSEFKYCYKYPHHAVTTDCVIFGFDGRNINVLLIERGIEPFKGSWALPGGFLRTDENAEQGALRELKEETGLSDCYIRQIGTFSDIDRDPRERVITIAFTALVKLSKVQGGDDASQAKWFPLGNLPSLAFDHKKILNCALTTLKERIDLEPIAAHLLNDKFTIPEMQTVYETILGEKLDRRNFMRKVVSSGLVIPLNEKVTGFAHRAPSLFKFNK